MECKHEHFIDCKSGTFCFDPRYSVPAYVSICMDCRKTRREISLEAQLSALQQQNEELTWKLTVQTETALQEQVKRERAEAQAAVHQKMVDDLIDSRNIQRNNADGSYMCGILNGLELAVSIFTGDEPEFAENTAGAELLARVQRYEAALREIEFEQDAEKARILAHDALQEKP